MLGNHSVTKGKTPPNRTLNRGTSDLFIPKLSSQANTDPLAWSWTEHLEAVQDFLERNHTWPSPSTPDPIEASLASWLNANLDLYWNNQLEPANMKAMKNLSEAGWSKNQ